MREIVRRRWTPELIFLLLYIPLAVAMMLAIPLGEAPDEQVHLKQSWLVSTGQFQKETCRYPANLLSMLNRSYSDPDALTGDSFREARIAEETVTAQQSETTGIYPQAAYIPQGAMMFLTRLFTDRIMLILYSARIGNILIAGMLFFMAIRRSPVGKYTLMAIGCLPLTLQQAASASCDGLTIAGISWITAEMLRRINGTEEKMGKQLAVSAGAGICAVLCKLMYVPVLLLGFVPKALSKPEKQQKRMNLIIMFGTVLTAATVWYLLSVQTQAAAGGRTADAIMRLGDLLLHPIHLIEVQVRTVAARLPGWIRQLFGAFGHMDVFSPWALTIPLGISFLGVALADSGVRTLVTEQKRVWKLRVLLAVILILCFILISGSLMIWWTDENANLIEGIQGRYFLPCLFCLLICFPEIRIGGKSCRISAEEMRKTAFAVFLAFSAATVIWLAVNSRNMFG